MTNEEPEHQLVVCRRAKGKIEAAIFFIDGATNKKGRMGRHPPPEEPAVVKGTGTPVANDPASIASIDITQVTIAGVDARVAKGLRHQLQNIAARIAVIGIEDADDLAAGFGQPLVHGIVQPTIRLRENLERVLGIPGSEGERSVGRPTIDDEMFRQKALCADTVQRRGQGRGGVEGGGDEGDVGH